MQSAKVSVLMPIYNTNELHLREAIDSILSQTFSDFEFLILNDSPENTKLDEVVKSYKDKRIKYIKNNKNIGITPSRNKLIEMAKGEYLAIMDHDDISLASRFEKEVEILDNNSDIGVVSTWVDMMVSGKKLKHPQNDIDIKIGLMGDCFIVHPASMIRKSILIDNNIMYEAIYSPAEDYCLWCRLIEYTKFYNIQEVLFRYRDHLENTTHKQQEKMYKATLKIWEEVRHNNPSLYNKYLKCKNKSKTSIKLFFIIPLLKITNINNIYKCYLFGCIPLLKIKIKKKL